MRPVVFFVFLALTMTAPWAVSSEVGVCECQADVDGSGNVDINDWACIQDCKGGSCGCCVNSCDINCDGVVDDRDAGDDPLNEDSMWRCQFIGIPADECCGACCDTASGVCTDDVWSSNCLAGETVWSQGLRCSGVSCSAVPTGACCDLDFGTCENDVTETSCVGGNVSWMEGEACSPINCPPPASGACCNLGNGLCKDDVIAAECAEGDRVWTDGASCESVACAVPPQDPCDCDGEVDGESPFGSVDINDITAIIDCASDDCDRCVESCDVDCNGVVDLIDMGVATCNFYGKSNCCDEPSGACRPELLPSPCTVTTPDGCDLLEGVYAGDGTYCAEGVVVPTTSAWGLAALVLGLVAAASVILRARCARPIAE